VGSRRLKPAQSKAIDKDELRLGHINGVFGLKGEVRLFLYNPNTEMFEGAGGDVVLVDEAGVRSSVTLRSRSGAGKRILGRMAGVDTPEAAGKLVGVEIVLDAAALPEAADDEFYHHELIGLPVRTESGTVLGRLTSIFEGPDTDIWMVSGPDAQSMIPAVRELIIGVDLEQGITVVDGAGQAI
jgi:16S rRNA processing protein RimM